MSCTDDRSRRLYGLLLRLYPAHFREEYGDDACELFVDRIREARRRGGAAVIRLWLRTVVGSVIHGLLERLGEARRRGPVRASFAEVGHPLRRAMRSPGLSAIVITTLGLGLAANVALFSVLRSVLLRPLPYPEADRLVQLWEVRSGVDDELHGPSPLNFTNWVRTVERFEAMAAWYLTSGTYRSDGWVEEIRSAQVTPDFFRTLGVEPMLGRDFRSAEVERYGPVMLSHQLWTRRFGADPAVVGRTVVSSGGSYEIVGVMPSGFSFPDESVEAWIAWNLPAVYGDRPETRGWRFLGALGRLSEGASIDGAEEELDGVAARLAERYPELDRGWDVALTSLHDDIVGDARAGIWIAFGSVAFTLLLACANVANLLLARVPGRMREMKVRVALGASSGRIARELLAEGFVLALAAGVLGVVLAPALIDALVSLDAGRIPRLAEVSVDPGVLLFAALATSATGVLFGAAPTTQLVRGAHDVAGHLGSTGTREQARVRDVLVALQVAVTIVLLTGAGLLSASLRGLMSVDTGLDPGHVASFRVSLDPVDGTDGEIVRYYEGLIGRIEKLPGVERVGAVQTLPMNPVGNDFRRPYRLPDGASDASAHSTAQMRIVTAGYFDAIGMRLLTGTGISPEVRSGDPLVVVVNETLARRVWLDGRAVGRLLEIDFREGWQSYRVVGVVRDVRHYGPRSAAVPELFLAHTQAPYLAMSFAVKTTDPPATLFDPLRRTVRSHQPMQPAHNFVSLDELVASATAEERFLVNLLAAFAGLGLLLAATGIYGVISYSVSLRRREIGVRMALGAEPRGLVRGVLGEALRVVCAGTVVGLAGVWLLSGTLQSLLFGVRPGDPGTVAGVVLLLGLVAFSAAGLPAYRAARIAPTEALRPD